jgi:uncharacterized protein YdeI (YjbR/CyaY-like superfamily)
MPQSQKPSQTATSHIRACRRRRRQEQQHAKTRRIVFPLNYRIPKEFAMSSDADADVMAFATADEWCQWLKRHHKSRPCIWIKFAKKASGIPSVTYAEALDAALCHGWIDGQVKSIDGLFFRQRFTPRRPRSIWSKRNVEKARVLVAAGRMTPAGQAQIDAAQRDGRWAAAYDSPSTMQVPADLHAALLAHPKAAACLAALSRSNLYALLSRLQLLKRAETRAKRVEEYIRSLNDGTVALLLAPKNKRKVKSPAGKAAK